MMGVNAVARLKNTELGPLPEDWAVCSMAALCTQITVGIVIRPAQYYVDDGVPTLRSANIREGGIDRSAMAYITAETNRHLDKSQVHEGDVLTVRTGYPGTSAVVPPELEGSNSVDILISRPSYKVVSEYLAAWLNSSQGKAQVQKLQGGLAQQHFNVGKLRSLLVACPSLPEQRAISSALSDIDSLVDYLDVLIAQKRAIRIGVMQRLVTGRTRLEGFEQKWLLRSIGDLLTHERPDDYLAKDNVIREKGEYPVLTANQSFVLGYSDSEDGVCRDFPVIVFDDFTTECKYVDFPFKVRSSAIKILKPRSPEVNLGFVFERMQLVKFPVGNHKRYYISEYRHLSVPVPEFDEQGAIYRVLREFDAEISALERTRDKAYAVRRGMMQSLLTGHARLIDPVAAQTISTTPSEAGTDT